MDAKLLGRLKSLNVDIAEIPNEKTREEVILLSDGVEQCMAEIQQLTEEIQQLKDELNRLKGEQGKPDIRPQKKESTDHSSEEERKPSKGTDKRKKSKKKKHGIKAHRQEVCRIDQASLPEDAVFKGYDSVIIQGVVISADNVEFKREVYYSPSEKKRYLASLPAGYQGEFTPGLKAWVLDLHYESQMTEPAIYRFLTTAGVKISPATISRILTDAIAPFHAEKREIVAAGLKSSRYQQIDDTGGRVNGKNHFTHVLCNPLYTAYFTRLHKDRLTVLEILSGEPLSFVLNEEAFESMKFLGLPEKYGSRIQTLSHKYAPRPFNRTHLDALLAELFPNPGKHHKNRQIILEACAVTAYRRREDAIKILLCDDAPQFKNLTEYLGLCWVHDGRHYKKLSPFRGENQKKLSQFLTEYWAYYHALMAYKEAPDKARAQQLKEQFDVLFSQTTGYGLLDGRIAKTRAKKENLLLVLEYPELPLHNNASELGARRQARYRDISLQTKNRKGTEAKDTMMTLYQTARKWGVNFFEYLHDRLTATFSMPSLASLIWPG
jgi:hypothetical protein